MPQDTESEPGGIIQDLFEEGRLRRLVHPIARMPSIDPPQPTVAESVRISATGLSAKEREGSMFDQ
ncbi:hypothetical protein K8Q93_02940 [Candidatus Parcubacteria bacterium]|nr:hypothetical protein [Candidatus Parcubacteria bacterium]